MFYYLYKLEILDLKWNRLTNIEEEAFGSLSSLTTLDMSNNMLTFEDKSSNSVFRKCTNLEDVQLQNNSVTTIHLVWSFMENLQTLNLAYNKISHLRVSLIYVRMFIICDMCLVYCKWELYCTNKTIYSINILSQQKIEVFNLCDCQNITKFVNVAIRKMSTVSS